VGRRARIVVEEPRAQTPDPFVRDLADAVTSPESELLAGATSFKDFPLSDRERPWDAAAAKSRWASSNGIGGDSENWSRYHTGFFWYDGENAETVGAHKLPFVDVIDGTATAVWRGVTAAAGVMRGARGGAQIPSSDTGAVQGHIGRYYAKARAKYDDPEIKVPWESAADEEEAAVKPQVLESHVHLHFDGQGVTLVPPPSTAPKNGELDVDLPPELQPQEARPRRRPTPNSPAVDSGRRASQVRWEAVFAPEGRMTDDGRIFAPNSISWRELPLSLMAMLETDEGHKGAQLAGRIDRIWRDEKAGLIRAEGVFDDNEFGQEIARLVGDRTLTGNSVDLAVRSYEIGSRADYVDEDGNWIGDEARAAPDDEGEPDLLDILFGDDVEEPVFVVRDAVIGMSTVCPFPAFAEAEIGLAADGRAFRAEMVGPTTLRWIVWVKDAVELAEGLTAAAAGLAPVAPPAAWFSDPELAELTPVTVTDEGRVYGHAAAWESCHIALPGCTVAPTSDCEYAYFHLKEVVTEEGDRVPCGTVTLDTGHADRHLGQQDATRHYDDTGTAVADVVVGEDEYGIWFSGALDPDVDAAKARRLRGSVLSGDWRRIEGNLELVALLAVNVPGFPVPRPRALVAAGEEGAEVLSLTAAGIHDGRTPADLTDEQRARLAALSARASGGLEGLAALARRA